MPSIFICHFLEIISEIFLGSTEGAVTSVLIPFIPEHDPALQEVLRLVRLSAGSDQREFRSNWYRETYEEPL